MACHFRRGALLQLEEAAVLAREAPLGSQLRRFWFARKPHGKPELLKVFQENKVKHKTTIIHKKAGQHAKHGTGPIYYENGL
jgi:hypothetical protein